MLQVVVKQEKLHRYIHDVLVLWDQIQNRGNPVTQMV